MTTITTRAGKGSPLTNTEVDDNFSNLNSAKYESGNSVSFLDINLVDTTPTISMTDTDSNADALIFTDGGTGTGALFISADHSNEAAGTFISFKVDTSEMAKFSTSEIVFNEGSYDADFRVESNDNANMLFVDASTNRVGIGKSDPARTLDVHGSVEFSVNTASHETFIFSTQAANDAKLMMQNASSVTAVQLSANGDTFFNGGNVAIGASSPISLDGNATPGLTITSNGPFIVLQDANNADKVNYIANNTGVLQFGLVGDNGATGKTEVMSLSSAGAVFNDSHAAALDFRVESDNNANMLFVDSGNNTVTVGSSISNAGAPFLVDYNNTSKFMMGGVQAGISNNIYYNGSAWASINNSVGGGILQIGTDGSFAFRRGTAAANPTLSYSMTIAASGAATFGSTVTVPTNLYVGTSIVHQGDTNTSIDFSPDVMDLYSGASLGVRVQPAGVTINEAGANNVDFRVESDGNTHALFVDASESRVGIANGTPKATLDVSGPIIAGAGGATGGGLLIAHRYGGGELYDSDTLGSIGSEYSSGHFTIGYGARAAKTAAESTATEKMYSTYDNFNGSKQLIVVGQYETIFNFTDAPAVDTVNTGMASHNSFEVHRDRVVVNQDNDNVDFLVRGENNNTLLFADASLDRVGVGKAPSSTLTVSNTANSDGGNIADFGGHDAGQRLIVANFSCGSDESRAGLYWENQGVVNMRMWMADTGKLYLKSSNPASNADGDRVLTDQANVGGTGDRGLNIPHGDRFGFDETGTRSWTMKATAGNLTINSGDGNGQTDVNMNLYTSGDLTVNGAHHKKGAYQSTYGATYIGSEYLARGLSGIVLHTYADYYASWNTSTETIGIFEVSHDSVNWADKYIMVEVFHTMYSGGGYARYFWNSQYNTNSLVQIEKSGSNSGVTAAVSGLTTVTGNHKKATFNLTFGYYQHATVRVTSNMTASTTITGPNQLRFLQ